MSAAEVRQALGQQMQDAIGELLRWTEGQFAFDSESVSDMNGSDVEIQVDPQGVLLEAFRRMDEASRA